jgi:5-methylcytosine-specific restriction endonuclease McrA
MIINFNGIDFATKKIFSDYIKNLIKNEIGICNSLKSTKYWNQIEELLKRHPEYNEKISNMKDVIIRYSFFNNIELCIINNDNSETSFSYLTAIKGKSNTDKSELSSAMRESISDQIKSYRKNNILSCSFCGSFDKIEIDHVIPFNELRDNFLKICENNNIRKPCSFDQDDFIRRKFKNQDLIFKNEWNYYHLINAELQSLCSVCHKNKSKMI